MGKLFTALRNAPKRSSALFAMIAAATIVPAIVLAWGPDRPTFTVEKPADHITFNSITNNPSVGDERNFTVIKDAANTSAGGWEDEVSVQPGKEYLVRMYVHNNAAANLNKVATNTRVMAHVPTTTGKSVQIDGFVSADNASPQQVWDQAILKSGNGEDFNVAYVPGSTTLYNNVFGQTGTKLSDSIVTNSGAPVGYDKLDGKIPGCFEYAGYVTFKVKPQFAAKSSFEATKQVRKAGEKTWAKSVAAKPGETVEYQLTYKNSGEVSHKDVVINDYLPKGLSYIDSSSYLMNGTNPNGLKISDNVTKASGVNVGNYAPAAAAYVKFSAKVEGKDIECGTQKLVNKVRVTADGGYKEDAAEITVDNGQCKPNECKPGIPVGDKRCENCPVPGKENLPKDSADCKETPVTPPVTPQTPTELPTTGPAETMLSIVGLGALIASIGYYVSSRRAIIGR